jgi:DNA processing protein
MRRGDLDLAIARMAFLKAGERARLAMALDRTDDLSVLSIPDIERLTGRPFGGASWNPAALLAAAGRDRAEAEKRGISFVSYVSDRYPPLLRELVDPPTVLFYRGSLPDPEQPLAGVVGTRAPSSEGARQAYAFGRGFGRSGVAAISGLALGVDALVHRGNLEAGAPTVAVLGSGADAVYPASNRPLARRILESGGALVSEYPPGTPPLKHHFPARNRIIAGLSRALVVVEAPVKSGALISAEFALDQGRDLWVSAACLDSPVSGGCRNLARDGARVARNAFDVVADWGHAVPDADSLSGRGADPALPYGLRVAKALEFELEFDTGSPQREPAAVGVQ